MSEHFFESFVRFSSTAGSRRGYAAALIGLVLGGVASSHDDVEAKRGGRKRRSRRKSKKKSNMGGSAKPPTCAPNCTGKTCGDDGCGGSCGVCGVTELCAQGKCVVGRGTCPTAADVCNGYISECGSVSSGQDCNCWTTMANEIRCGNRRPLHNGNDVCRNDAQCVVLFPEIPGVFCMQDTGEGCPGGGACFAPCPL
jgi:hypothetical protein